MRKPTIEKDATPFVPETGDLASVRAAAAACRGCALYLNATQTVFGTGAVSAQLMLVGEQPGDQEDRQGEPFVGPAGKVLARALEEAEVRRENIYLTNAVKHFRFSETPARRLHKRPGAEHIRACRPWLSAEVRLVQPRVLVCLGAVAVHSVFGKALSLTSLRGNVHRTALCESTLVTSHPSAILRIPDAEVRKTAFTALVEDLRDAARRAKTQGLKKAS